MIAENQYSTQRRQSIDFCIVVCCCVVVRVLSVSSTIFVGEVLSRVCGEARGVRVWGFRWGWGVVRGGGRGGGVE